MTSHGPLRRDIERAIDDAFVDRVWVGVGVRRAARKRAHRRAWIVAAAVVMALAVGMGWSRHAVVGPIHLAGGGSITAVAAPGVALDDGSRIDVTPGAAFHVTKNSPTAFEGALRGGVGTFDVTPGGPRRWVIDCGLASVEVIGTRFVIESTNERVKVHVDRGHVRVRSASGTKDLVAGEEVSVESGTRASSPSHASRDGSVTALPTTDVSALPEAPNPHEAPTSTLTNRPKAWKDLARSGNYDAAYASLGDQGVTREVTSASIDELLSLADVARLSGHPGEAVAPLSRVLARGAGDPRVSLAAFSLGRIELDSLGHPTQAASAFARAIELGLPAGLVEDAYVRLVEARTKGGDIAGAKAAYAAYRRSFHDANREAAMRRWIGD